MSLRFRFWSVLLTLGCVTLPAVARAGDPFRSRSPQPIGPLTEQGFQAVFQRGDYPEALKILRQARQSESGEPLVYALLASTNYVEKDWKGLAQDAAQTKATAAALKERSPLRSHLYLAVGEFLTGAAAIAPSLDQGRIPITAIPQALAAVQQVYENLNAAAAIDPNDPELNLVRGFIDLMVASNLPLANADQAIAQLEKGAPVYVSQRGVAVGLRNLRRYPDALKAVDKAIAAAPDNADLYYLKAQILADQASSENRPDLRRQAALEFRRSLQGSAQMPKRFVWQLFFEACRNQEQLEGVGKNCVASRETILDTPGPWGPTTVAAF